jgi:acyl-coenzyme A synthetase/AMP-(fatty) acid ligase
MILNTPFTVLAMAERGYQNGFAVLGLSITAFALAERVKKGVSSVVVFTDATSDKNEVAELQIKMDEFGLALCEVPLPFVVDNLGKWDEHLWRLFDMRLTRVLTEKGLRNERYQA